MHIRGGKQRDTPLHIAARVPGGEKCALMLLKSGAGVNLPTEDGQTPVHAAAQHGNLSTLTLLLEDGGDPLNKSKVNHLDLNCCHVSLFLGIMHLFLLRWERRHCIWQVEVADPTLHVS